MDSGTHTGTITSLLARHVLLVGEHKPLEKSSDFKACLLELSRYAHDIGTPAGEPDRLDNAMIEAYDETIDRLRLD